MSEPTQLDVVRLSAYLAALGKLGSVDQIPVTELLKAAKVITHDELVKDLESLGFANNDSITRSDLARALRKETRQVRLRSEAGGISPFEMPSVESLLGEFTVLEDVNAHRAEAIEIAYSYSAEQSELFLLGHGLLRNETAGDRSTTNDQEQTEKAVPGFGREAVALKHQIEQARRIVQQMLGNAILVHEVGLGKTLTAILVLCEMLLRDPTLTSLTLVPTNLLQQWLKELARCPDVETYSGRDPREILSRPHVLMPIDTAKESRWERILKQRRWGLLVVDEGHILRNDATLRYRFVYSLAARHRLLLTATPVHNSAYDIYHQANIVRPGLFGRKAVFAESYMRDERQVMDADQLRSALKPIISRVRRSETGIDFPDRDIAHVRVTSRSKAEAELYDDVLNVLRGIYRRNLGAAAYVRRPSGQEQGVATIVLVSILILRELASHPLAALKTLSEKLVDRLKATHNADDLQNLEKLLKKHSHIKWEEEGCHGKTDRLIAQIPQLVKKHGRVIVYVEFRETQKTIVARLQSREGRAALPPTTAIISYHGELSVAEKDHQVERFEQQPRACFISTDSGGQGLNLQAGHVVVNFDFPWNPMRVEQRIGRVDRLRQQARTIVVRNFITVGTIEQYVYNTLRSKLKVCDDVLGHLIPRIFKLRGVAAKYLSNDDVLGIGQIILSSENNADLQKKFEALDQELQERIANQPNVWRPAKKWIT